MVTNKMCFEHFTVKIAIMKLKMPIKKKLDLFLVLRHRHKVCHCVAR